MTSDRNPGTCPHIRKSREAAGPYPPLHGRPSLFIQEVTQCVRKKRIFSGESFFKTSRLESKVSAVCMIRHVCSVDVHVRVTFSEIGVKY